MAAKRNISHANMNYLNLCPLIWLRSMSNYNSKKYLACNCLDACTKTCKSRIATELTVRQYVSVGGGRGGGGIAGTTSHAYIDRMQRPRLTGRIQCAGSEFTCNVTHFTRPVRVAEWVECLPPVLGDWGNPKIMRSSPEPVGLKPGHIKSKTLNLILVAF